MLKFKQYIQKSNSQEVNKDKNKIPAVILVPNYDELKRKFIQQEKDQQKKQKKRLKESQNLFDQPDDTKDLEHYLHGRYNDFTTDEDRNVKNYSDHSFQLNGHLIGTHHLGLTPNEFLRFKRTYHLPTMDNLFTRKSIGKPTTVFSGVGFDPTTQMSESGHIHLPAYTSTSISPHAAFSFAKEGDNPIKHMFKIDLKDSDRGTYIGTPSGFIHEREFVLPRNTTLRIHKSEMSSEKPGLMIHHATIDNDVNPEDIERDPNVVHRLHDNFHEQYKNNPENEELFNQLKEDFKKKIKRGDNDVGEYFHRYPDLHSFIFHNHPNIDSNILEELSKTEDQSLHRDIFNHTKANSTVLANLSNSSYDRELHRDIFNHPKTDSNVLAQLASNTYDDDLRQDILNHPKTDSNVVHNIVNSTYNDTELYKDLLHHPKTDDHVLANIINHSTNYQLHKKILEHQKTGPKTLKNLILANSGDDSLHRDIFNHPKTNSEVLKELADKTFDRDLMSDILHHPKTDSKVLQNLTSSDHDLNQDILHHDKVDSNVLTKLVEKGHHSLHRDILHHDKVDSNVLSELVHKSNDKQLQKDIISPDKKWSHFVNPEVLGKSAYYNNYLHKDILNHPKVNSYVLNSIVESSYVDPSLHRKILEHPENDGSLLYELAYHSKNPSLHKDILNHPLIHNADKNGILVNLAYKYKAYDKYGNIDEKILHNKIDAAIKQNEPLEPRIPPLSSRQKKQGMFEHVYNQLKNEIFS